VFFSDSIPVITAAALLATHRQRVIIDRREGALAGR